MSRSRDDKGRFIKTPHPKTNLPPGVDPSGKVEHRTPAGKVKLKSGQRLTLIERQILLAHET